MKKAILKDVPAGKIYDLTALIDNDTEKEITVGREEGNVIQLGKNSKQATRETRSTMIHESPALLTVSGQHATIRYDWKELGEGFYLRDHSKNGTTIGGSLLLLEYDLLRSGVEIFFGAYGPVIYEEISESSD